jgi:hypothetical protein
LYNSNGAPIVFMPLKLYQLTVILYGKHALVENRVFVQHPWELMVYISPSLNSATFSPGSFGTFSLVGNTNRDYPKEAFLGTKVLATFSYEIILRIFHVS